MWHQLISLLRGPSVLALLMAPFVIIPAAVIGFVLVMLGNEEMGLWICAGTLVASAVLGPLTYKVFSRYQGRTLRSRQELGNSEAA